MFEFDVNGQNATRAIAKKENGVGLKTLAPIDTARAATVGSAPVVGPERLLGRLRPPAQRSLFFVENAGPGVIRLRRRPLNQPVPDFL
jgi:hypothetical protein